MLMRRPPFPAFLVLLFAALPTLAVIPQFWETRTWEDWGRGDLDGVSVTGEGELVLAPSFGPVYDTGETLIFSAVADAAGNVYLGTGHRGRLFRVSPAGEGDLLADFGELDVLALTTGPDGTLYAATSPNGKVYRIRDDAEPEVFFDPEDLYIWDLRFDPAGRLLVATGENGIIYRVGEDGVGEVFYDSDTTHILSLGLDTAGQVLAGGSPGGYLYRISDAGRAFVLYDSGMEEVRMLAAVPDGRIFAAVLNGEGSATTGSGATPAGSPSPPAVSGTPGDGGGGAPRSRILEVLPSGAVRRMWESDSEMVFSVLPVGEALYFSTGTKGRIYVLGDSLQPGLIVESGDEETTRLIRSGERILAAASNRGRLWELGGADPSRGTYVSEVRDTGAISTWGRLSWSGSGVRIETRSGNTRRPDSTWSEWTASGSAGEILSPPARFVQWRGTLAPDSDSGLTPLLSGVTLPYLQQNLRPEVGRVDVLQPGLALRPQTSAASPTPALRSGNSGRPISLLPRSDPRTEVAAGAQALRWTATDANEDPLEYSLYYRGESEDDWKLLAGSLTEPYHTIEPDTLPDGIYVFRVVASDARSNPPNGALEGERVTPGFAIDQTPPVVSVTAAPPQDGRVRLDATAADQTSTLKAAGMSVDGGEWLPVFPVDGIVDTLSEAFVFDAGPLAPGEHVISFRIYDQNENVGIGKTIVRIP